MVAVEHRANDEGGGFQALLAPQRETTRAATIQRTLECGSRSITDELDPAR